MITGPGLGGGISAGGRGQAARRRSSMQLAEDAGFFPSVFATTPNPMRSKRPAGELGPRYTITYTMPGPNGVRTSSCRISTLREAEPGDATRRRASATSAAERTVGGWYVASHALKDELVAAGLPESAPPAGELGDSLDGHRGRCGSARPAWLRSQRCSLARRRWPGGRHATT